MVSVHCRRSLRGVLLFGGLLCMPAPGAAQETTGQVQGRLVGADGGPVAAALVTATSRDLLGTRRAVSARDGVFHLAALPPGRYALQIAAIGFQPMMIQEIQVRLGRVTGLGSVFLQPAAIALETMRVTAPNATVDPVRTTVGGTLDAADYAALPTNRDYTSLITMLPHINASSYGDPPNSAGSTGLENLYFIDGVNVTDPLRATGGTALPSNFVKSVEVRSGGYEAQYGRALGAIVNAVTYSGSNRIEGNVFAFLSHDGLSAAPRDEPTLRESRSYSYDVGARLSGPVVRDRLWFSGAYSPRISQVDRKVADLGTFTDRMTAHVFAGKLTGQVGATTEVTLSLFGDPTVRDEVAPCGDCVLLTPLNPDPYLHRIETGGLSASLRAIAMPASWLLLEGTLARSRGRDNFRANSGVGRQDALLLDYVENTVSGGLDFSQWTDTRTDGVTLQATASGGAHRVLLGGEFLGTRVSRADTTGGARRLIRRRSDGVYTTHWEAFDGRFRNSSPALYIQDSWRAGSAVTINAGLRWSRQTLTGTSGQVAQRLTPEWQPRLGFTWQLGSAGSSRVFGSFGRFVQHQPLNLASAFYVDYQFREWTWASDPRQPNAEPTDSINFSTREAEFTNAPGSVTSERFDEFTLGFEHLLGSTTRLTLRVIRRDLGTAFVWAIDPASPTFFVLGSPGEGDLEFLPKFRRAYTGLEADLAGTWRQLAWRMSYVLSRTRGNYPGLFGSDFPALVNPGVNYGLATADQVPNSTGLLPNDRPHVLKLIGTWRLPAGLEMGGLFTAQSGTPVNEFGIGAIRPIPRFPTFLVPRGSAGRTPAVYDLNLRLAYGRPTDRGNQLRAVIDLMHIGNPRRAVQLDQQHYFSPVASPSTANPNFLRSISFQPPMAARLGLELTF